MSKSKAARIKNLEGMIRRGEANDEDMTRQKELVKELKKGNGKQEETGEKKPD